MNRVDRRKLKKRNKGQNVIVNPDDNKPVDHSADQYCHNHKLNIDNIDKPTDRDKKLIQSIRLIPYKTIDKNSVVTIGRACHRCGFTITIKPELTVDPNLNILNTEAKNVNLSVSELSGIIPR